MTDDIDRIADKIAARGCNVVFTGAGISTESGIPDYRSQGGLWDQFQPVYFDDFMSSKSARIEYWRQKNVLYHDLVNARPNAAHMALAQLYAQGLIDAVITQNIDGLHQEAGLPADKVIELHGSNRRVRCMHCGQLSSLEEAHGRIQAGDPAPECTCGGYLKPDTISFGQSLPVRELRQAGDLAGGCDVFVVIGSTLIVQPAALMPEYALINGAFLAIINLSETPYDNRCDVLIREKAGTILPQITAKIQGT